MARIIAGLGGDRARRIISAAEIALDAALTLFSEEEGWGGGRSGIYLCVGYRDTPLPLLITPIRNVLTEKAPKYFRLSQEKQQRLFEHPDHFSSWQSQNLDADQFPGAIRLGLSNWQRFGISGLPNGLADEAIALGIAGLDYADWGEYPSRTLETLDRIAKLSSNPYWEPLSRDIGLRK